MKFIIRAFATLVCGAMFSMAASAQLTPFEDYTVSDGVWDITTIKVHPNMIDDYLEGIEMTWIASNKVAKDLGHIDDYAVWVSQLPQGGDFNILLGVRMKSAADMQPSKERYDAFMAAWGEANQDKTREVSKNYPAMREITGQYLMRSLTFK